MFGATWKMFIDAGVAVMFGAFVANIGLFDSYDSFTNMTRLH